MELSERCIQTLENEGFKDVYEWSGEPGVVRPEHTHKDEVTVIVTEGSIDIKIEGEIKTLRAGDRFDIPPDVLHSALVGPSGCQTVVGKMGE
jgi:quercetin dioxygenase-like cupin family protein